MEHRGEERRAAEERRSWAEWSSSRWWAPYRDHEGYWIGEDGRQYYSEDCLTPRGEGAPMSGAPMLCPVPLCPALPLLPPRAFGALLAFFEALMVAVSLAQATCACRTLETSRTRTRTGTRT